MNRVWLRLQANTETLGLGQPFSRMPQIDSHGQGKRCFTTEHHLLDGEGGINEGVYVPDGPEH